MNQPREKSGTQTRSEKQRQQPERGGGRMTENRPDRSSANPPRKDRSGTNPAGEAQVWNGDFDDEADAGGNDREEPGIRRDTNENDKR